MSSHDCEPECDQKSGRSPETKLLGVNAMNMDSLIKSDEREYLLKPVIGKLPAFYARDTAIQGSILVDRPLPAGSFRSGVKNREEKRLTPKLLLIDMLTNALIVIVIASVSYFFIAARSIRPALETSAVASDSDLAELR